MSSQVGIMNSPCAEDIATKSVRNDSELLSPPAYGIEAGKTTSPTTLPLPVETSPNPVIIDGSIHPDHPEHSCAEEVKNIPSCLDNAPTQEAPEATRADAPASPLPPLSDHKLYSQSCTSPPEIATQPNPASSFPEPDPTPTSPTPCSAEQPRLSTLAKKRKADEAPEGEPPVAKQSRTATNRIKAQASIHTPFKSPLLSSRAGPRPFASPTTTVQKKSATITPTQSTSKHTVTASDSPLAARRAHHYISASRQFKSPLLKTSNQPSSSSTPSGQNRRISLERRLHLLKQAHKIKSENSEAKLKDLIDKWTKVAREAAEDLWDIVKDSGGLDSTAQEDDWGYDDRRNRNHRSWGWDDRNQLEDGADHEEYPTENDQEIPDGPVQTEAQPPAWSLGTMLTSMGIPPDTLGWDENEGEFVER
ncbi:hypothetical protein FRB99_004120 [Tulasnella sp. 403]|nr:hypothetical protein FRB99_004120 [Tulasnella sp. 403]